MEGIQSHNKLGERDFQRLIKFLKDQYGLNMANKKTLIEGRLDTYIQRNGFEGFEQYVDYVLHDNTGREQSMLISKVTTNFTYFMRERQHYDFLKHTFLPEWTPKIRDHDLRIWSAGCSSGEEPYTLAMLLMEELGRRAPAWDHTVLATDISSKVLDLARQGIYSRQSLQDLPPTWKSSYFQAVDEDTVKVVDALRKQVVFSTFNLMETVMPFKRKFHAIFCRNVMIYFDNPTKEALANRYYSVLEPGGYLFIGLSETLNSLKTPFRQVQPSIYRKEA